MNGKKLIETNKRWVRTELNTEDSKKFREVLRDYHINFETSECGNGYIHFEVLGNDEEIGFLNEYISRL